MLPCVVCRKGCLREFGETGCKTRRDGYRHRTMSCKQKREVLCSLVRAAKKQGETIFYLG